MTPLHVGGRKIHGNLTTGNEPSSSLTEGDQYYNTTTDKVRYYDGSAWKDVNYQELGSSGNPATSAQQLYDAGQTTSDVYYISTPDGGTQQVYCLMSTGSSQGGNHGWMLVHRLAADASSSITGTMSSQRGLTDVSQSGSNKWSADFGTFMPTEMRFISAGSSSDWWGTRGVDFILEKPDSRSFVSWIINRTSNLNDTTNRAMDTTGINGGKQGIQAGGARDGYGNWTNSSFSSMRISDPNGDNNYAKTAYFQAPGSSMWYMHSANDAKWAVHNSQSTAGQDDNSVQLVGYDDNHRAFYNNGTTSTGQNSTERDYSHAFFIFIR